MFISFRKNNNITSFCFIKGWFDSMKSKLQPILIL